MSSKQWNLSFLKGHYALVTGASEGLGSAFASELAKNGMNLILVARRIEPLHKIAEELQSQFGVITIPVACDLSKKDGPENLFKIIHEKNIRIRALVNNAGQGFLGPFKNQKLESIHDLLSLNCFTLVTLCKIFLEDLLSYETSVIINVSSLAAYQPIPYMGVYAASKSLVHSFSQALHWEVAEQGLYVQTLAPGAISTGFNKNIGVKTDRIRQVWSADQVVQASMRGLQNKDVLVVAANQVFFQKVFAHFFPIRFVLKKVSEMFWP